MAKFIEFYQDLAGKLLLFTLLEYVTGTYEGPQRVSDKYANRQTNRT